MAQLHPDITGHPARERLQLQKQPEDVTQSSNFFIRPSQSSPDPRLFELPRVLQIDCCLQEFVVALSDPLIWRFYRFKTIHNKTVSLPFQFHLFYSTLVMLWLAVLQYILYQTWLGAKLILPVTGTVEAIPNF